MHSVFLGSSDWLLLFYVPLKNFSLIWRRHHCRWGAAKFRPMLSAQGLWAGRDLFRVTPAVTRGLGFSGLIRRTAQFSRLLRHMRGCGGSILTRILMGFFWSIDLTLLLKVYSIVQFWLKGISAPLRFLVNIEEFDKHYYSRSSCWYNFHIHVIWKIELCNGYVTQWVKQQLLGSFYTFVFWTWHKDKPETNKVHIYT
jgi:hypothetical protein